MEKKDPLEELNKLINDIDCLQPLSKWINNINIFNILKLDRMEIRHSNMLAWLINPNENHGLKDRLIKKILFYATTGTNIGIMNKLSPIDVDIMNLDDAVVYREKNKIDILLVSEKNKLAVAFENKIGSGEHSNQLNRYRELLQKEYGQDYYYVLIYLTPVGEESSDSENWISMNYDFIIEELSKLINLCKIDEKVKRYVEDYIEIVRRKVVEDKELRDLCKKIYINHKDAFDLIFDNKPDLMLDISDWVYEILVSRQEKYDINVWNDHCKTLIRFTPNSLVSLCGEMGSGEWCHNKILLGFEVQNYNNCDLCLKIIIGPVEPKFEIYRQKLLDVAIKNDYKMQGKKLTDKWKTIKSYTLVNKNQLTMENYDNIKTLLEIAIDKFLNNDMPKLVEELSVAFHEKLSEEE